MDAVARAGESDVRAYGTESPSPGGTAAATARFPAPGIYLASRHSQRRRPRDEERRDGDRSVAESIPNPDWFYLVDTRLAECAEQAVAFHRKLGAGGAARGQVALGAQLFQPAGDGGQRVG